MSGETRVSVSGWSVDTLKAHFDQRIADGEKAVSAALAAAEKAVGKAEDNAEKWREQSNEWRGAMDDRETRFISRSEVEAELKSIRIAIDSLKESRASMSGGARMTDTFRSNAGAIISAIVLLILLWRVLTGR